MLIDAELAKEKLISELHAHGCVLHIYKSPIAKLIRNTDLTDCQRPDQKLRDMGVKPRPILRSQFPDDEAKSDE